MNVEDWLGAENQLGIDIWNKKYRYGDESFDEWLELDLKYIRQRSFLTDWKIIFKTFGVCLFGQGE